MHTDTRFEQPLESSCSRKEQDLPNLWAKKTRECWTTHLLGPTRKTVLRLLTKRSGEIWVIINSSSSSPISKEVPSRPTTWSLRRQTQDLCQWRRARFRMSRPHQIREKASKWRKSRERITSINSCNTRPWCPNTQCSTQRCSHRWCQWECKACNTQCSKWIRKWLAFISHRRLPKCKSKLTCYLKWITCRIKCIKCSTLIMKTCIQSKTSRKCSPSNSEANSSSQLSSLMEPCMVASHHTRYLVTHLKICRSRRSIMRRIKNHSSRILVSIRKMRLMNFKPTVLIMKSSRQKDLRRFRPDVLKMYPSNLHQKEVTLNWKTWKTIRQLPPSEISQVKMIKILESKRQIKECGKILNLQVNIWPISKEMLSMPATLKRTRCKTSMITEISSTMSTTSGGPLGPCWTRLHTARGLDRPKIVLRKNNRLQLKEKHPKRRPNKNRPQDHQLRPVQTRKRRHANKITKWWPLTYKVAKRRALSKSHNGRRDTAQDLAAQRLVWMSMGRHSLTNKKFSKLWKKKLRQQILRHAIWIRKFLSDKTKRKIPKDVKTLLKSAKLGPRHPQLPKRLLPMMRWYYLVQAMLSRRGVLWRNLKATYSRKLDQIILICMISQIVTCLHKRIPQQATHF